MRALEDAELNTLEDCISAWIIAFFAVPLCVLLISMAVLYGSVERGMQSSEQSVSTCVSQDHSGNSCDVDDQSSGGTASAGPNRARAAEDGGILEGLSLSRKDADSFTAFILVLFAPPSLGIFWVANQIRHRIRRRKMQVEQHRTILKQLRGLTGVQAAVGAGIVATLVQLPQGPAEKTLLITTVLWSGTALFYFCMQYYQAKMELEI